jgi:hypothetical protein
VHVRSIELALGFLVAAGAQGPGAVPQQGAEASDVGVVTGTALPGHDRRVLDRGFQVVAEIVAAETNLLLVDLASERELRFHPYRPTRKHACGKDGRHGLGRGAGHRVPPCWSPAGRWHTEQSPSAKGMCTSGRSIPAIRDAWGSWQPPQSIVSAAAP